MRRIPLFVVILSCVLPTVAAAASTWTLGANVGLSILMASEGGGDLTAFSLPAQNGPLSGGTLAGLRIGFVAPDERHEFYLDWGLSHISGGGESLTGFIGTLNYQRNLGTGRGSTEPYLALGLGLTYQREHIDNLFFGSESISGTNPVFGGGIGVQHRVGNGHGALRGEIRYDRLVEGSGDLGLASANAVSFKLGFDLWMK